MNADQLKNSANKIVTLAEQLKRYKASKEILIKKLDQLKNDLGEEKITREDFDNSLKDLLKGKSRQQELELYDKYLLELIEQIKNQTSAIKNDLGGSKTQMFAKLLSSGEEYQHMPKNLKKKYLEETNLSEDQIKKFLARKKKGQLEESEKDYIAYEPHKYGKIANNYVVHLTEKALANKNLDLYIHKLFNDLRFSGFKIISKTYLSIMIFTSIVVAIAATLLATVLFSHPSIIIQILRGILIGITAGAATMAGIYIYPSTVAGTKQRAMKSEIPFMLINMSAVAGSGAKPIAMFQTLLVSKDYPAIGPDIKKIVNYVNVFGYDLSTALRIVSETTASDNLKEILNGMINTISSGGDMKQYLESVSQDSLTTYQLERKKSVESIATYSDIYTIVLIAAPLLFFVTIAIIQMLGGTIGGLTIEVIAAIGTYGVIPLLNIGFMLFISAVQPK